MRQVGLRVEVSPVEAEDLDFKIFIPDSDTAGQSKPEDMMEAWEDPGLEQRTQILTEVSTLLNEDSNGSSEETLPYSPRPENGL